MMMASKTETARTYRDVLADYLEQSARWRHDKSEQFPDDHRNSRSASALDAAVEFVRGLPETDARLHPFVDFDGVLSQWHRGGDPYVVLSTPERAGRFFFDNGTRKPTERDFEWLIVDALNETLESWRATIEESSDQPPGELVRYFEEAGVPLWQDEEDEGDA